MNAGLNAYVVHRVPLVLVPSGIPSDGNNTGLAVWVYQPHQSAWCRAVPLRPLQHTSWTLLVEASFDISVLVSVNNSH